ncbi:MAG: hypothetical protein HOE90_15400 [Bacteriovoracaceae bacterium]|jgi:rRNA maturation endonuclease Nob1|nr:hypothetical protein [Bacteriovoracaceae bacterium]
MKSSAQIFHSERTLIKRCHVCDKVAESTKELERCPKCGKAFLPLNYFTKVHEQGAETKLVDMFASCDELSDADLIKGIHVIW